TTWEARSPPCKLEDKDGSSSSTSQVVEQPGYDPREEQASDDQRSQQDPIEPRKPKHRLLIQLPQHLRPQVTLQLRLAHRTNGALQQSPHFIIHFAHGLTPARCKCFRSRRTARNTRALTVPTGVPNACAISS